MRSGRLACIAVIGSVILAGCSGPASGPDASASAEAGTSPEAASLVGEWEFETGDLTADSARRTQISGLMTVSGEAPRYQCRFTAHQTHTCPPNDAGEPNYYCLANLPTNLSAQQSCTLAVDGSRGVIRSTVESSSSTTYSPDDFIVEIAPDNAVMRGRLVSTAQAEVTFTRLTRN